MPVSRRRIRLLLLSVPPSPRSCRPWRLHNDCHDAPLQQHRYVCPSALCCKHHINDHGFILLRLLHVLYSQFCRMQHRIIWPGWRGGPSLLRYCALLHSKSCEYASINYLSTPAVSTSPPINTFSILQSPLMASWENLAWELDCRSE